LEHQGVDVDQAGLEQCRASAGASVRAEQLDRPLDRLVDYALVYMMAPNLARVAPGIHRRSGSREDMLPAPLARRVREAALQDERKVDFPKPLRRVTLMDLSDFARCIFRGSVRRYYNGAVTKNTICRRRKAGDQ
jgi:hypothetical protein